MNSGVKSLFSAVVLSLLIHALIAAALIAYLEYAPHPDVLATLDLSSVELSFAEVEAETAAVAAPPPQEEEQAARQEPKEDVRRETEDAKEEPVRLQTEDVKEPDAKLETKTEAREERKTPQEEKRETEKPPQEEKRETRDAPKEVRPAPAPKQARLDAPPKPKRNIRPDYPKGARQRGEQGEVVLEIRVNAEGSVDEVKVAASSGFAELDEAAVRAAKAAKFSPARSGRERVASTARLKLQFKLK